MKKLLTFLAIAALVAVSCAKEQNGIIEEDGPLANISFTVNSAELMTKADPGYAQATAINELLVQVFNKVGDNFVKLESPDVTITEQTPSTTPKSWIVEMKLAKNETYKIAFWAQKSGNSIYNTNDLSAVTVDYSEIKINNDDADAFCAARLVTVTGAISQTVKLYRPLAQINIGTNDLEAYKKSVPAAKQNLTATITLPVGTPNKLNVIGGPESEGVVKSAVSGTATEPVVFTTAPAYVMSSATLVSSSVSYDYLTMLYVLAAPGKETMDYKFKLNNGSTDVSDITVANMPYQANYRTNVVGQLLTGSFTYTVEIEEGMYGDYEKKVAPSFATLADLNTYLSNMQEGTSDGDNGDINPEQVVLTAMGAVTGTPQIVLPKILGGVDIRLAFEYDGTVDMVYAEGATDAQKPANIFFYAQKLNTLQATVPASHFELLSGSVVTNKAIVATNTNTFVIQNGARVGTAEIQKGNAHIAGTVATVSVPTGAKADDDNNPVQIFLEKESSVEKIILNAKTDVVVEQPKDQIEVEETEKKVAVYVNDGAANSTATAQNGGVIYVKAEVPCTVTVDGNSEAEDGSAVSSTVIIEDGAGGSTVNAENGGAINLTANDNCEVTASGSSTPEDPTETPVPSSVVIDKVDSGVDVYTETEGDATIEPAPDAEIDGDIMAYVAHNKTKDIKYTTLEAAFADAEENNEILVLANCEVTANIPVNFNLTLDVNGFTITNNVQNNRLFRIGNEGTMLEIKGNNGKLVIPESNKASFGFVDLRNQQNVASYYAGIKASDVEFIGATTGGSFFQARTHYQKFIFENVNVDCTDGDGIVYGNYANGLNASIINCYNCQICTVSIKGGTFKYASRGANYGVFQDYLNATTTLEDVTVISTDGPVNQGMSYSCLIKNCNFSNPNNVSAWDWTNTTICASNNKTIEVDGGSYEGNYACYVYTSGGTIHIKGGSFTGRSAALIAQVDNSTYANASSNIIVDDGTFNGPIKMDQGANCSITIKGGQFTAEAGQLFSPIYGTLSITGGTFSEDPSAYVAEGYSAIDNGDGTWTVIEGVYCPYDSNKTAAQNGKALYDKIMALPDGGKLKVAPGYYEWDNGQSRMGWGPVNKSITIEGLGNPEDITIATISGGRYGIVLQATVEGVVVTIKNVTFTGAASNTGFLHPIYVKDYMTLNLENVICKSTTANKYGLLLDSSNTHVKGVTTTVNAKGVQLDEGKWVGLMAKPRSDAYPEYYDEELYVTYCAVNILEGCNFTAENCEPQNGAVSTGYNLLVNGVAFDR